MATAKKTTAKAPAKAAAKSAKSAHPARSRTKSAGQAPAESSTKSSSKAPAKSGTKPASKAPAKSGTKPTTKTPAKSSTKPSTKPSGTAPARRAKPAKAPAKPATPSPRAAPSGTTARSTTSTKSTKSTKSTSSAGSTKPAKTAKPAKSPRAAATPTTPVPKASTNLHMSSAKTSDTTIELPKPKFNKDGLGYTKDFDLAFVKQQYDALQAERVRLTGQALRLEAEAHSLVEEAEMGDVKFDDEGGEGDTMSVERERDLALSAQAREAIEEIDAALLRITAGTYGYSVASGKPIPRERLEALPWSSVLVEEKVGGIGRR